MTRPLKPATDRRQINRGAGRIRNLERRFFAGGSLAYAGLAMGGIPQTIAGPSTDAIAWDEFDASDTEIFGTAAFGGGAGTPNNTAGDESLLLLAPGAYIIFAAVEWQIGVVNVAANIDVFRNESDFISQEDTALQEQLPSTAGLGSTRLACYSYVMTSVGADDWGGVSLNVQNFDASDQDVTSATLTAIYLPTASGIANVYGP